MSAYQFLLALGFWQWVGVLCLASIFCSCAASIIHSAIKAFKK